MVVTHVLATMGTKLIHYDAEVTIPVLLEHQYYTMKFLMRHVTADQVVLIPMNALLTLTIVL